jgi:hypothetical protein
VPKVVLIGGNGKIAFIGHPAERKLENDIETLLKGEELQGIKGAGGEESKEDGKFKELDNAKIDSELEKFKESYKSLASNEAVKKAAMSL